MSANQWDADWELSDSLARRLIGSQFPALSAEPVARIGSGWDNTVFRVGAQWVFRFPRRKFAVDLLEREWRLLPQLAGQLSIPYSQPLFRGEESEAYPAPFLGYSYLPGRSPMGLSDEQRSMSGAALARFLRQLHAFPAADALSCGAPSDHRHLLDLESRKGRMLEFLPRLAVAMQDEDYHALQLYVLNVSVEAVADRRVFMHGDLHFKNMLVDDNGLVSGIIDWGDMNVGHPACDLNVAYSFLPASAREDFFDQYGGVDEDTKRLARMIAVYIPMLILLQAIDVNDEEMSAAAIDTISRALSD